MGKTNSTFVRMSRWMGQITSMALVLVATLVGPQQAVAQGSGCGCFTVTVTLDSQCEFTLTRNNVSDGDCSPATIRVNDFDPTNGATVDGVSPLGGWTYGLFDVDNNVLCWGKVIAEDKTGPTLSVVPPVDFYCMEIGRVLNDSRSWTVSNPAYVWFAGRPTLTDNCCAPSSLKLKVSDEIHYNNCEAILQTGGIYAYITRTFIGVDCYGNESSTSQTINFYRPSLLNFLDKDYEIVQTLCDGNVDVAAVMKEHLSWNVRGITYNIFDLECNYSATIVKTTTFPVCGSGKKIEVNIEVFDWCVGSVVEDWHYLIKAYDDEAPTIVGDGGEISTGPMDCTATLPLDDAGLKKALGVEVTDNCSAAITKSYKVESRDIVLYGIPVDQGEYLPANYPVITVGGKKTMIGIPLGRHRLLIDAFDGCYNTATRTVYFEVVDKVAPVMKCDDKLNITLTRTPGDYYAGDKGIVYGKASVADVDEGSFDNCTLTSMKVRRIVSKDCLESGYFDGNWDYDLDNDKSIRDDFTEINEGPHKGSFYSPMLDYVEFFCCDMGTDVVVELWGWDKAGNKSYCWLEIHLEDKVTPVCYAPDATTIKCTDKEGRAVIYDELASNAAFGAPLITGLECSGTVVYSVDSSLHCDAGYYTRKWTAVRTVKGVEVKSSLCEQIVYVLPVHEYDIKFPADVEVACDNLSTVPGVEYYELGCDVLAVNVKDSEYFADSEGEACYKVFRTHTVINWCEFEEWNTYCTDAIDPMNFAQVAPRTWDEDDDGFKDPIDIRTGTGYWLLVRDRVGDNETDDSGSEAGMNGVEEFYISKDRTPSALNASAATDERVFPNPQDDDDDNEIQPNDDNNRFVFDDPSYENFCIDEIPTGYEDWEDEAPTFAWQYTQIIKVFDKVPPTVVVPELDKFATDPETCVAKVTIPFVANDSCGGAAVKVNLDRVQVAPGNGATLLNPSDFQTGWTLTNGTSRTADGFSVTIANIPEGDHALVVTVRDDCGNVTVKRLPFKVADCKGPAPICISGLTMPLMPGADGDGMMAIWASDFLPDSPIYDCNGQGETNPANSKQKRVTKFSINKVGDEVNENKPGLILFCSDFTAGPVVMVEIHAWDTKGNHLFCETFVELTDPNGLCTAGPSASIAGAISTEGSATVEGVQVNLSGNAQMSYTTDVNGQFNFSTLRQGADYTVAPQLNKGFLNGVSTFDLVLISKHILNVQPLNSPYKLIAADVNNSKSVTTLDLIQLRKLILNIDTELANNSSWRFVDASFAFPSATNPWQTPFPEVKNINNLAAELKANFVAVKIGDVNGNAVANSAMAGVRSFNGNLGVAVADRAMVAGNEYTVDFTAADLAGVDGYQFTLNFDRNAVELVDIVSGIATEDNFGVFAQEGVITTSWNGEAKGGVLFSLVLRAKADGQLSNALNLNSRYTAAEAYKAGEVLNVGLNFTNGVAAAAGFELYQNTPNPFQGETMIGFNLPEAAQATITIQDVTGRTLRVIRAQYAKGYNQVSVRSNELPASGVLYYTLEAANFTATKKMVIVE